jgi:hypothetical protein
LPVFEPIGYGLRTGLLGATARATQAFGLRSNIRT